jgi:hypothetical protein
LLRFFFVACLIILCAFNLINHGREGAKPLFKLPGLVVKCMDFPSQFVELTI